jgi:hypothetical protein
LKLSPQQVAAAKARGFALFPASQSQIDRMTMQRRIFEVEGRPHVVSRDGVYYETHATLAPTLAHLPAEPVATAPEPSAPAEPPPPPAAALAEPPAAPEPAEAAAAEEAGAEDSTDPRAPRRRILRATGPGGSAPKPAAPAAEPGAEAEAEPPRRTLRRRSASSAADSAVLASEPTAPTEAETNAETEAATRRRWQVEAPRWQVAGAMRRGRAPRQ